jgi:hypothetical protein
VKGKARLKNIQNFGQPVPCSFQNNYYVYLFCWHKERGRLSAYIPTGVKRRTLCGIVVRTYVHHSNRRIGYENNISPAQFYTRRQRDTETALFYLFFSLSLLWQLTKWIEESVSDWTFYFIPLLFLSIESLPLHSPRSIRRSFGWKSKTKVGGVGPALPLPVWMQPLYCIQLDGSL